MMDCSRSTSTKNPKIVLEIDSYKNFFYFQFSFFDSIKIFKAS